MKYKHHIGRLVYKLFCSTLVSILFFQLSITDIWAQNVAAQSKVSSEQTLAYSESDPTIFNKSEMNALVENITGPDVLNLDPYGQSLQIKRILNYKLSESTPGYDAFLSASEQYLKFGLATKAVGSSYKLMDPMVQKIVSGIFLPKFLDPYQDTKPWSTQQVLENADLVGSAVNKSIQIKKDPKEKEELVQDAKNYARASLATVAWFFNNKYSGITPINIDQNVCFKNNFTVNAALNSARNKLSTQTKLSLEQVHGQLYGLMAWNETLLEQILAKKTEATQKSEPEKSTLVAEYTNLYNQYKTNVNNIYGNPDLLPFTSTWEFAKFYGPLKKLEEISNSNHFHVFVNTKDLDDLEKSPVLVGSGGTALGYYAFVKPQKLSNLWGHITNIAGRGFAEELNRSCNEIKDADSLADLMDYTLAISYALQEHPLRAVFLQDALREYQQQKKDRERWQNVLFWGGVGLSVLAIISGIGSYFLPEIVVGTMSLSAISFYAGYTILGLSTITFVLRWNRAQHDFNRANAAMLAQLDHDARDQCYKLYGEMKQIEQEAMIAAGINVLAGVAFGLPKIVRSNNPVEAMTKFRDFWKMLQAFFSDTGQWKRFLGVFNGQSRSKVTVLLVEFWENGINLQPFFDKLSYLKNSGKNLITMIREARQALVQMYRDYRRAGGQKLSEGTENIIRELDAGAGNTEQAVTNVANESHVASSAKPGGANSQALLPKKTQTPKLDIADNKDFAVSNSQYSSSVSGSGIFSAPPSELGIPNAQTIMSRISFQAQGLARAIARGVNIKVTLPKLLKQVTDKIGRIVGIYKLELTEADNVLELFPKNPSILQSEEFQELFPKFNKLRAYFGSWFNSSPAEVNFVKSLGERFFYTHWERLPFSNNTIKLVVMDEFFPVLQDIQGAIPKMLGEIARVLQTGGQARINMMGTAVDSQSLYTETEAVLRQLKNSGQIANWKFLDGILIIFK